jgi:oxygen-independent coproporphyrinogen-3 oxidase
MAAGVYLHIPFCKSRCSYCDFATDVWRGDGAVERYVNALCLEIAGRNPSNSEGVSSRPVIKDTLPIGRVSACVDTVYFGGGTPSLLKSEQVQKIFEAINWRFDIADDSEITMEMNPATVTPESLVAYRSLGVNRASFGVQTFNDRHLRLLARGHDADDARQTFKMLRHAGFEDISFDLIAGLPGQTIDDWKRNLEEAVAMEPEHLSLYLLEIHEGTPLAEQLRSGRRPLPDPELAAEMYELMLDELSAAGYEQYEISNFAKPGFESRHNTKYWRLDTVFGFGVSAHSFDGFQRYSNIRDTNEYVSRVENHGSAEANRETIDRASEFAFLGLRLNKGVDLEEYKERFGFDLIERYCNDLERIQDAGLVESTEKRLRLTRKGMLYSNEVFQIFVSDNVDAAVN